MSNRLVCCLAVALSGLLTAGSHSYSADQADNASTNGRIHTNPAVSGAGDGDTEHRAGTTIRATAYLEGANPVNIRSEVQGESTILYVVPDGSTVRKGDLLVELDSSAIKEEQESQEVKVETAQSELSQAEAALAVLERDEKNSIAAATLGVKVAEMDRDRCLSENGELAAREARIKRDIAAAKMKLKIAQDRHKQAESADKNELRDEALLAGTRLAILEASNALEDAQTQQQLATEHIRPYYSAKLEFALLQAALTLSRRRGSFLEARMAAQSRIATSMALLKSEKEKLDSITREIESCRIHAPCKGVVSRGATRESQWLTGTVLEPGVSVHERQVILAISDMRQLQARMYVKESLIDRIREGQHANVRFYAFPGRTFGGKVVTVNRLPTRTNWQQPDVRKYVVAVSIDKPSTDLKIGMTGAAEIDVSRSVDGSATDESH
jgi:HlyD family secretion protein